MARLLTTAVFRHSLRPSMKLFYCVVSLGFLVFSSSGCLARPAKSVSPINARPGEEVIPLHSGERPELKPHKIYRITLRPTPTSKQVYVDFHTTSDDDGNSVWIDGVEQSVGGEIAIDEVHLPMEVQDFNLDGTLDLKVLDNWGTGGSLYQYFRWNGKRYVEWKEPDELGLNGFDLDKRMAFASWRSGPSFYSLSYRIEHGTFRKVRQVIYDQAKNRRAIVPKNIPDDEYVGVIEEYDGKRLLRRVIKTGDEASSVE